MPSRQAAFLFDLDGTLVDSVYQHVLAWREALEAENIGLSVWRIHRKIGMSGGLLTNMLLRETGTQIDPGFSDRVRQHHAAAYNRYSANIRPLPGACELLAYLTNARIPWAIATSGRMETARPALELLGIDFERVPVVTRDQVTNGKPDPDLFLTAAERLAVDIETSSGRRRQRLGYAGSPARPCSGDWHAVWRLWPGRAGARRRLSGLRRSGRPFAAH